MPKTHLPKAALELLDKQRVTCDNMSACAQAANASRPGSGNPHNNSPRFINVPSDTCQPDRTNVKLDKLTSHILWRETHNLVEEYRAHVREGVDVKAASRFARWLRFSGVLQMLPENPMPLECHGAALSIAVEDLIAECGHWFVHHERARDKPHAQIPKTELERINAQLAHLTVQLAKLSPPNSDTANAGQPALQVIAGGVV